MEGAQAARGDETKGIPAVCVSIASAVNLYLAEPGVNKWLFERIKVFPVHSLLSEMLAMWAQTSGKPVVLLLDKACAPGECIHHEAGVITLENVLHALIAADALAGREGAGRPKMSD